MGSPAVALWRTRDIQWLLIRRDLKIRYGSSSLGYLWTILDPLATCLVFWLVFGLVFAGARADGNPSPYIVFLVCGYLPWQAISGTISGSSRALNQESKLVRSTSLPRELWVLRVIGSKSIELLLALPVLFAFMIVFHKGFSTGIVFVPLGFAIMVCALMGIGMALSMLTVLYKDLERIVPIILRLLFYMTPVLYPSSQVIRALESHPQLEWIGKAYFLNPFVTVIDLYRCALWSDQFPGWGHIALASAVSLGLLLLGVTIFRRLEGTVLKEI